MELTNVPAWSYASENLNEETSESLDDRFKRMKHEHLQLVRELHKHLLALSRSNWSNNVNRDCCTESRQSDSHRQAVASFSQSASFAQSLLASAVSCTRSGSSVSATCIHYAENVRLICVTATQPRSVFQGGRRVIQVPEVSMSQFRERSNELNFGNSQTSNDSSYVTVFDRWKSFEHGDWRRGCNMWRLASMLARNKLFFLAPSESRHKTALLKCVCCRKQFPVRHIIKSEPVDSEKCIRIALSISKLHAQRSSFCTIFLTTKAENHPPTHDQLQQMRTQEMQLSNSVSNAEVSILPYDNSNSFESRCEKLMDQSLDLDSGVAMTVEQAAYFVAEHEFEEGALFNVTEREWMDAEDELTDNQYTPPASSKLMQLVSPARLDYLCETKRHRSFLECREAARSNSTSPSFEQLAHAGFFRNYDANSCTCFCCNTTINDWDRKCDVWIRHARAKSDCAYVIMVKGERFVQQALALPDDRAIYFTSLSRYCALTNFVSSHIHKAEPREIRSYCEFDLVRILCEDLAYDKRLIYFYVELCFIETGDYPKNVQEVLEGVRELNDRMRQVGATNVDQFIADVKIARQQTLEAGSSNPALTQLTVAPPSDCRSAASIPLNNPPALMSIGDVSSSIHPPSLQLHSYTTNTTPSTQLPLRHLNEASVSMSSSVKGSDDSLCVVCADKSKECIFLPCAHRACCRTCAQQFEVCPICRTPVKSITVYFDA